MKLQKASLKAIKHSCRFYHYSKAVPVNPIGYSVFNDKGEFCGVIVYGPGANNHIASSYKLKQGEVVELTRVALNGKQESTSKVIAISLKLIKKDLPTVKLVVSYADVDQEHVGTVYQASNWYFQGKVQEGSVPCFIINGKKTHTRTLHSKGIKASIEEVRKLLDPKAEKFVTKGKYKYIYPLDKKLVPLCQSLHKDYPKKYAPVV